MRKIGNGKIGHAGENRAMFGGHQRIEVHTANDFQMRNGQVVANLRIMRRERGGPREFLECVAWSATLVQCHAQEQTQEAAALIDRDGLPRALGTLLEVPVIQKLQRSLR